jgi:hypothetical protein
VDEIGDSLQDFHFRLSMMIQHLFNQRIEPAQHEKNARMHSFYFMFVLAFVHITQLTFPSYNFNFTFHEFSALQPSTQVSAELLHFIIVSAERKTRIFTAKAQARLCVDGVCMWEYGSILASHRT